MDRKQRQATAQALSAVSEAEQRVILATGSYIGEGLDDARLDTLFLATPASAGVICFADSWRLLQQHQATEFHTLEQVD